MQDICMKYQFATQYLQKLLLDRWMLTIVAVLINPVVKDFCELKNMEISTHHFLSMLVSDFSE